MSLASQARRAAAERVSAPPPDRPAAWTVGRWGREILVAQSNIPWRYRLAIGLTLTAVVATLGVLAIATRLGQGEVAILAGLALVAAVTAQVMVRREMFERLALSRTHWCASSPRGLAEIDGELRIMQGNARLASLTATDEGELVGMSVTQFFPEDESAGITAKFKMLLSGAVGTIESDSLGVRSDRSRIWLHWRATMVRRLNGSFDYFVITFEDTTQKHDAERAAAANLAELEKLNRLKSEFTSMVSHEFRTALTGIQGMSELINGGDLGRDEVLEYSGYIFKEAERINRLITDMLDLDRLESGKMTMQMIPVDVNATIEDVARLTRAVCTTHAITTDLDPTSPAVLGDSYRLVQVITNLVSNAIKYSPDGGEIVISSTTAGGKVQVSVRDHGVGIAADFVDHLFGKFERYEKSPTKVIGTGLGLAITRQIVEMHGGRIWVERAEGGGSVFHFAIPAHAAGRNLVAA